MSEAILSIGTNLGDRAANLARAVAEISSRIPHTTLDVAPTYETEPVGVPEQFKDLSYYNTAVAIDCKLAPDELSRIVHKIEDDLGRTRDGVRNSPRVIDIDIISYGGNTSDRRELRLPHPEAAKRRFVLQPVSDIRPDLVLPGQTLTIAQLLSNLPATPTVKRIHYNSTPTITRSIQSALSM